MTDKKTNGFYAPDDDYTIPSTSSYMEFKQGDNRFRILGLFAEVTAVKGVEYCTEEDFQGVPHRIKPNETIPPHKPRMGKYGVDKPKFFWAFPVWNYQENKIQILEIRQVSILETIKKVIDNPKWGDPRDYDFIVTRQEEGGKTVYTVTNNPKEKLDTTIIDLYITTKIDMQAWMDGDDPFAANAEEIADAAHKALG